MKQCTHKNTGRQLAGMGLLVLILFAAWFLTYKTELQDLIYEPVKLTLASLHKLETEYDVVLDSTQPALTEVFTAAVPDMKTLSFRVSEVKTGSQEAALQVRLASTASGEAILEKTYSLSSLKKKVKLTLPKQAAAQGEELTLQLSLVPSEDRADAATEKAAVEPADSAAEDATVEPADSAAGDAAIELADGWLQGASVALRANTLQGLVSACNGDAANKTNIISEITYSNGRSLKKLYMILGIMLLLFTLLAWYLLVMKGWQLGRAFLPLALLLGLVYAFVIPPYSVPDENIHMDNAYKYANVILGVEKTGNPGTIYKRAADVLQADLMANTLESNHYRQLLDHFLERPDEKGSALVEVFYADAGMMVPAINYIPCAVGIALGRALGTSPLVTLTLGCYLSLVVFVLLAYLAIQLLPYGKNAAAMLMLVPIALQQGASASYDAVANGALLLFVACCLRAIETLAPSGRELPTLQSEQHAKKNRSQTPHANGHTKDLAGRRLGILLALIILLALYIARTKGGVYLPLCLLILVIIRGFLAGEKTHRRRKNTDKKGKRILVILGVLAIIAIAGVLFYRTFWSFISPMLSGTYQDQNGQGYSLLGLLMHPAQLVYKFWNSFQRYSESYLRGLMGGVLSWLDITVNKVYPLLFLGGTILLAHTEGDRFTGGKGLRCMLLLCGILSVLLIMLSMLVAYTATDVDYITGVQGRYFLGFALVFFLGLTTDMIHVDREHASGVAMAMMAVEVLTVLSAVGKV